jgi:ABC-type transport system substrate-binding protein
LDRNTDYFQKPQPYLDGMKYAIIKDRTTLLQNFYAGRIDWTSIYSNELADVKSKLGTKVITEVVPSNQRNHVFMNTTHAPFNDIRVRKALSLGLDRKAAIDVMDGGEGITVGSYMNPKGQWALPESVLAAIPGYTQNANVTEAKALLAQAGVKEGTEVKLLYRSIFPATGVYMADQLGKLGFKVTSTVLEGAAIYAAGDSGDFDIFIWTASPALDDPDAVMGDVGVSSAPRNWSKITVPEADDAYKKQSAELDAAKRKALVNQADKALTEAFASIVLEYDSYFFAYYPKVKNKDATLTDLYTNMRFADVWLA